MKSKEVKRMEAIERQRAHDLLNNSQKINKLLSRPGECRKELTKLGYYREEAK